MKTFLKKLNPIALDCIVLIILEIPLFVAGNKIGISIQTIVSRLVFLFFCAFGMIILNSFIQRKTIRFFSSIILSFVLFLLVLVQCSEFYNFFMQEETFNYAFYMSMIDIPLIMEQLPHQVHFLVSVLIYICLFVVVFNLLARNKTVSSRKQMTAIATGVLIVIIVLLCCEETAVGNFVKMICEANEEIVIDKDSTIDKDYYEKLGISVCDVGHDNLAIQSKGIGKNLVFIILESLEANFLDEELFPGLTPNLNRFRKDLNTINFSDMNQYAGHTAESMFQTFWGFPSTPVFCTSTSTPEFNLNILNKFVSMPYIFTKAGYSWDHIQSPNLNGFKYVLPNEGISIDFAQKLNLDKGFKTRDKNVFEYAWSLFQYYDNHQNDHNFVISISTVDSHTPNGIVDENTLEYPYKDKFPKSYANFQLLNAIYTTDHYLGVLIDNILNTKAGKNTIIAIMNDHRFMGSADGVLNKKERKNIFMILNADEGKDVLEKGSQIDVAPTILDYFDINSNYVFPCGVSLLNAPIKDYSFRTDYQKYKNELSRLAYMKSSSYSFQGDAKIYFVYDCQPPLIKVFGKELPAEIYSKRMSYITFSQGDGTIKKSYSLWNEEDSSIEDFRRLLDSKEECVIFFQQKAKPVLEKMLYSKIHFDPDSSVFSSKKYTLTYRDKDAHYITIFADKMDDLFIDADSYKTINKKSIIISPHSASDGHNRFSHLMAYEATNIERNGNNLVISGINSEILSKKIYEAEENVPIIVSCNVRNTGTIPISIYSGFVTYDKKDSLKTYSSDNAAVVIEGNEGTNSIVVWGAKLQPLENTRLALSAFWDIPNSSFLPAQVVAVTENNELSLANIGPFAVPSCINNLNSTSFSNIVLASPLFQKIDRGSIVSLAVIGDSYVFCEDIVLEPGEDRTFNWSTQGGGMSYVRPFIRASSSDGKTNNTISISYFSIMN